MKKFPTELKKEKEKEKEKLIIQIRNILNLLHKNNL